MGWVLSTEASESSDNKMINVTIPLQERIALYGMITSLSTSAIKELLKLFSQDGRRGSNPQKNATVDALYIQQSHCLNSHKN